MEKISIKPHFYTWVSDLFYELSYLIHCNHFVDVFPLIIVIVTSRNTIFFVLMKKKKNFKCEMQYFTLYRNPSQWTIQWNYGHCRKHFWLSFWKISFCDNMRIQQKKCVQLCFTSHSSAQNEKLNICIVCYITNHQNSWISKFILYHLQS